MNTELQLKIQNALDSRFIGETIFSDEEIDEMRKDCKSYYQNMQRRYNKNLKLLEVDELVVLIVNIAKKWIDEEEGRFWVKLYNEVFEDGSVNPSKFYDEYETSLERHNHILFKSKENKRMFRETFLLHSFAPETSSNAFIKLLWGWYSDNEILNFDYSKEDDYSLLQKFVIFLRNTFSNEKDFNEDVTFEGNIYQIKSSFKYLFTQDPDNGYELLHSIFSCFNTVYRASNKREDSFFWTRCSIMINKMLEEARVSKSGRRSGINNNRIIDDYSKIHIDYGFNSDNKVVLVIPEIRAIDETADEYVLTVFNGDKRIYQYEGYVLGEGFRRKIKSVEIPLEEFIDELKENLNIRVTLSLNRDRRLTTIYDSKQSLVRDYILFKSSREIRVEVCSPGSYYIVLPTNTNIADYTNCEIAYVNNLVISLVGEEGNYVALNNRRTFFSTKQKGFSQFIPDGKVIKDLYFIHNGLEVPVFSSLDGISILSSDITNNISSIAMKVNEGNTIPLSEIAQIKDSILYVDLAYNDAIMFGYNRIDFFDMTKFKLVHSFEFCGNDKIKIRCDGYAFSDKNVCLKITGSATPLEITCDARVETARFNFNEEEYIYKLPYISFRIDKNEWMYDGYGETLWHEDQQLHNNCLIEINNNSCRDYLITANGHAIDKADDNIYRLGDVLTELEKEPVVTVDLTIGKRTFELIKIANEEILDDFELDIEEKKASILPFFIGPNNSEFEIELESDEQNYSLTLNENFEFDEDIEDNYYHVCIYLKDFFGDRKLLLEGDYAIGNPDKIAFINSFIELTKFNKPDGGKVKLSDVYIMDIEYLRNEGEIALYSANLQYAKRKVPVEVHVRDSRVLTFYLVENESFSMMSYDLNKKMFVKSEPNGDNIIPCGACYYEVGEL